MKTTSLRFYEELNAYLPEKRRKVRFEYSFPGTISLGEIMQALHIPMGEIDLVLVNQQSRGFDYLLQDGDQVSVYPVFERLNVAGISQLREKPLRAPRFICDVHLGRLSKYLRMLGWDTLYSNRNTPAELIAISLDEERILLSKNYQFSRREEIDRFYWIRSSDSVEQVLDIIRRLDLSVQAHPFTRCLECNHPIEPVGKQEILQRLQDRTAKYYDEFFICPSCLKIYWKGSHYEHMMEFILHAIQPG